MRNAAVPVLMYHALSPASTRGFRPWTLAPERFADHLGYFADRGYRSVTISELQRHGPSGVGSDGRPLVALTFDDAYADFHVIALPLLVQHRFTATLYVPSGYVSGTSGWMRGEGEGLRDVLSWSQLAEVARCGVEIGAHSHTHPRLDRLTPAQLWHEVSDSKSLLEDRLGAEVPTFAYPYGRYDVRVREAVARAGYRAACTMNSYAATGHEHPLELPRTSVYDTTDVTRMHWKLAASRNGARRFLLRARRALSPSAYDRSTR